MIASASVRALAQDGLGLDQRRLQGARGVGQRGEHRDHLPGPVLRLVELTPGEEGPGELHLPLGEEPHVPGRAQHPDGVDEDRLGLVDAPLVDQELGQVDIGLGGDEGAAGLERDGRQDRYQSAASVHRPA